MVRRRGSGNYIAPRIEQVLMPEDTACPCCRGKMVEIGTDSSERLDVIPARFRRSWRTLRVEASL